MSAVLPVFRKYAIAYRYIYDILTNTLKQEQTMRQKLFKESVLLRMQEGTTDNLRKIATRYGQTVSEYLRQLVRKAVEKEATPKDLLGR